MRVMVWLSGAMACMLALPVNAQEAIRFSPAIKTPGSWPLGAAQRAIDAALKKCKRPGIGVDKLLGKQTADGIATLRTCAGFETSDAASDARALTPQFWARLLPGSPFPSVADRARAVTFNYEGTDYDRYLWNVGQPADPFAFGTWGPFGATLAQGGEIQAVITNLGADPAGRAIVDDAFTQAAKSGDPPASYSWRDPFCATPRTAPTLTGSALLRSLSRPLSATDKAALEGEFCSPAYAAWPRAFAILGKAPAVIAAYDQHYAVQNRQAAQRLANLYDKLGIPVTEIDWAFFFDRATQFTTDLVKAETALKGLPSTATPAQRRLAISRSSRPSNAKQRVLRVGRDMAFIAGSIDQKAPVTEEWDDWRYAGRFTAQQLGLSDDRTSANPF